MIRMTREERAALIRFNRQVLGSASLMTQLDVAELDISTSTIAESYRTIRRDGSYSAEQLNAIMDFIHLVLELD